MDVSTKVSQLFQKNYAAEYSVEFEPKSDVNKSLSISTKIYASNIDRGIDLANVGAGVRSIYILSLLEGIIYRVGLMMERIDDIKQFVRGHDLFGLFGG
ncbi:hypothetical protein P9Z84_26040 [Bacillus cereus]|nr:hypothetical protein [Bacillus cereus]